MVFDHTESDAYFVWNTRNINYWRQLNALRTLAVTIYNVGYLNIRIVKLPAFLDQIQFNLPFSQLHVK